MRTVMSAAADRPALVPHPTRPRRGDVYRRLAVHATLTAALLFTLAVSSHMTGLPPVVTHGNERPAGVLKDGVLSLKLRADVGLWRPQYADGPALTIDAFAEGDGPLVAPAPLIRVPEGTEIVAEIRNDLDVELQVHGLCARTGTPCAAIEIPASASRTVRFRSGRPGTYTWWASSGGLALTSRFGRDGQLSGAFIVDPVQAGTQANGARVDDRVFVITEWVNLTQAQLQAAQQADDPFMAAMRLVREGTTLINGLSWPDTERLTYRVGDTVRWRFVNASAEPHPLHLHGFYFDVDSVGDGVRDTIYAADQKPRVVTQLVPPGGTVALTWTPERAGNWLFHCHIIEHVSSERRLGRPEARSNAPSTGPAGSQPASAAHADAKSGAHDADHGVPNHGVPGHDVLAGMAGMVLGITVHEREGAASAAHHVPASAAAPAVAPRALTLAMRSEPRPGAAHPVFGFVQTDASAPASAPAAADAAKVGVPGPTLVLRRDEPVEITLVNQLPEATAVHWHGMELDSYYDGVHGFGGMGPRTTPLIAPGESFVVKFTPPRTGTFMYHTHMHDNRQLTGGLYGALLVIDPAETYDAATDHSLVIGRDSVVRGTPMVLNGSRTPQFSWRAGQRHRLRFMNITRNDIVDVALRTDAGPAVLWRPLTKDGAPVPSGTATLRAATQTIAVGETYDFEFDAPGFRRALWLEVRGRDGLWEVQGRAVFK